MSSLVAKVEVNELVGSVLWESPVVHIELSGTADATSRDGLRELLREAHAAAKVLGAKRAVINLRPVRFMNSSCICVMLGWANIVAAEREDEQYPIHILWDPAAGWEKRSLRAIVAVACGAVTAEPAI